MEDNGHDTSLLDLEDNGQGHDISTNGRLTPAAAQILNKMPGGTQAYTQSAVGMTKKYWYKNCLRLHLWDSLSH